MLNKETGWESVHLIHWAQYQQRAIMKLLMKFWFL